MTHEREHERTSSAPSTSTRDPDVAPGRTTRTAAMNGPDTPLTSGLVMRKGDGAAADGAETAVARAAETGGHELPGDLRERFEGSLGTDLSAVRVHTDAASAAAADAVAAKAYAVGNDVHFAAGQYDPGSTAGQELIAHEVAHTVQQRGGTPSRQHKLAVSHAGDALEVEADRAAASMVAGAAAMVTSGGGGTIARDGNEPDGDKDAPDAEPQPADPDAAKPDEQSDKNKLSDDDKAHLENATQLLDKAKANAGQAGSALSAYATAAPGALTDLSSAYEASAKMYAAAREVVERKIRMAKEDADTRCLVLNTLLDAALAGVLPVLNPLKGKFAAADAAMHEAWTQFPAGVLPGTSASFSPDFGGGAGGAVANAGAGGIKGQVTGPATAAAKKAAGMGGAPSGGDTAPGGPSETAFLRQYNALQGEALKLLPLAIAVGKVNTPIGELTQAIKGVIDADKPRTDYPIAKMEHDAAAVESGTRALAAAAPGVNALLADLTAVTAQTAAIAPTDEKSVQAELVKIWISTLIHGGSSDLMDEKRMEEFIRLRGVFKELGVDIGAYFSDEDEALMIVAANAQKKVLDQKGTALELTIGAGGAVETQANLPGLPGLPVVLDKPHGPGAVRAVVVNAVATRAVTQDVLKQGPRNKEALAGYLLRAGFVAVVARVYEDVKAE